MAVKKKAKKSPAKKAAAKRIVAKKRTAKRTVKKTAKKSVTKRTAKRTVKRTAKKTAKRTVKRTAKKSAARISIPALPARFDRTSAPISFEATPSARPAIMDKPVVRPKQGTSNKMMLAIILAIALLAIFLWSKSSGTSSDDAPPTPSMSASAEPSESASAEPSESAATVTSVEAPSKFVALKSADGLMLRWIAPMATDGLTGYNVEIRAGGSADWKIIATVPVDQLTQSVTKSSDSGWTQFRVSSVYSDGQIASATVFGIPGEFA